MDCSMPRSSVLSNLPELFKFMSIESMMLSKHLILCHPLFLLPSVSPSMKVFSRESVICISWPKHCSFYFSISSSNEYSGLISFRIDWVDVLTVQGSLKSHQHHSLKASILKIQPSLWSSSHINAWLLEKKKKNKHSLDYRNFCGQSNVSAF